MTSPSILTLQINVIKLRSTVTLEHLLFLPDCVIQAGNVEC
jgi:hypothetical protein